MKFSIIKISAELNAAMPNQTNLQKLLIQVDDLERLVMKMKIGLEEEVNLGKNQKQGKKSKNNQKKTWEIGARVQILNKYNKMEGKQGVITRKPNPNTLF